MSRTLGFGIVFKEPVIDLTEADLASLSNPRISAQIDIPKIEPKAEV